MEGPTEGEEYDTARLMGGQKNQLERHHGKKTAETPNFVSSAKRTLHNQVPHPLIKWQRSLLITQSPKREYHPSSRCSISTGPTTFQKYMGDVIEFCHKASETDSQAGKPRS
jgi:hypothetical protein